MSRIRGFFELARPLEWSKSFFAMTLALLTVFYVFGEQVNIFLFCSGLLAIFVLWSGLYALNDWSDFKSDLIHKSKRFRPIPSGRVKPKEALLFSVLLIIFSYLVAFFIGNWLVVFCMIAMSVNQTVYTFKPFRFKDRKFFDIISGAFINPVFRYLSGLFLFVPLGAVLSRGFPVLPLLFLIGIQVSSYLTYRYSSKEHDLKINSKGTAAGVTWKKSKIFSQALIGVSLLSGVFLVLNWFTLKVFWLGFIPWHYVLVLVPGLILAPVLKAVIRTPAKATDPKSYRKFYFMFHLTCDVMIFFAVVILFFMPFL